MPAFVSSPLLSCAAIRQSSFRPAATSAPPRPPARRHAAPRMLSAASLASELIALSAVGAATYFFLIRDPSSSATGADDDAAADPDAPPPVSNKAVLGLSTTSSSPDAVKRNPAQPDISFPPTPLPFGTVPGSAPVPPPAPAPFPQPGADTSVGVDINDYLDLADASLLPDRDRRRDEEMAWAISTLLDLPGCGAAVVLDTTKRIVLADGALITDTSDPGATMLSVSNSRQTVVEDVTSNASVPFLSADVRSVACVPVGAQGAALLLGSDEIAFFGEKERRVVSAVCERLSPFLYVPPALSV